MKGKNCMKKCEIASKTFKIHVNHNHIRLWMLSSNHWRTLLILLKRDFGLHKPNKNYYLNQIRLDNITRMYYYNFCIWMSGNKNRTIRKTSENFEFLQVNSRMKFKGFSAFILIHSFVYWRERERKKWIHNVYGITL